MRIYLIGGRSKNKMTLSSCVRFNTNCHWHDWHEIREMKQAKANASCAVFEGRLDVTGGFFDDDLDTVEMNDHTAHVRSTWWQQKAVTGRLWWETSCSQSGRITTKTHLKFSTVLLKSLQYLKKAINCSIWVMIVWFFWQRAKLLFFVIEYYDVEEGQLIEYVICTLKKPQISFVLKFLKFKIELEKFV